MSEKVNQILEACLDAIDRGQDPEEILSQYPQDASAVRPLVEMAAATTKSFDVDIPPPPSGLTEGRQQLLDAAARKQKSSWTLNPLTRLFGEKRRQHMRFAFATKLISAILVAVVGTTAVGGGVAAAATNSLPGDTLYPVKLSIENTRLDLASSPTKQANLSLDFADERVEEIEALVEEDQPIPESSVTQLERHLHYALRQAAQMGDAELSGQLERVRQRTQTQIEALAALQAGTQERQRAQSQLHTAQQACERVREEAQAGLADPQTFRTRQQQREHMPDNVTPPESPENEPGNEQNQQPPDAPNGSQNQNQGGDGSGQHGSGEPDDASPGNQQGDRQRDQDQDQNQVHDPNQNAQPESDQQQDQQQGQQQDRQHQEDPAGNQQQKQQGESGGGQEDNDTVDPTPEGDSGQKRQGQQ